jgi:hypothetical protein
VMKNHSMLIVLAVFGVCLASLAQQAPNEPLAQAFRYRFAANTQSKYRVNAQMTGTLPLFGGLPVEKVILDMTLVLRVRQVRADGSAELGIDVEAFKAEMDGQLLPLPLDRLRASVRDLVYVVTPQGEVLERRGGSVMPFSIPVPGVEASQLPLLLLQLVFPKEAVILEREWSYARHMSTASGDPPAQFTARWAKDEAVSNVPASLFNQTMRWHRSFKADIFDLPTTDESLMVKQITQQVAGESQVWFSRTDGQLLKSVLKAQYEQQTRLLNLSESASSPAPARLTASVQVTREDLLPREAQTQQNQR